MIKMLSQEYEDWDEEKQYAWADSQKVPGFAYVYMWYAALHAVQWKHGDVSTFLFREDIFNPSEGRSGILNADLSVIWKAVTGDIYCIPYENDHLSMSVGTELFTKDKKNENKRDDAIKMVIAASNKYSYKKGTLANDPVIDTFFNKNSKDVCKIVFPDKMAMILQKPADDGLLLYAIDGSEQKEPVPRGVPYDIRGRLQSLENQALNTLPELINNGWLPIGIPAVLDQ